MKQIEVNTHSDRVELETEIGFSVIQTIQDMTILPNLIYYDENDNCEYYTTLGQEIFNKIADTVSSFVKVKEDESTR